MIILKVVSYVKAATNVKLSITKNEADAKGWSLGPWQYDNGKRERGSLNEMLINCGRNKPW